MKYSMLAIGMLLLTACGGASGGSEGGASPTATGGSSSTHTYELILTGDNVQLAPNLFANPGDADEFDINPGPVTVPVGGSLTYTVTGRSASSAFSRISAGVVNLVGTIYKDGVPVSSSTLTSAGTFHDFGTF